MTCLYIYSSIAVAQWLADNLTVVAQWLADSSIAVAQWLADSSIAVARWLADSLVAVQAILLRDNIFVRWVNRYISNCDQTIRPIDLYNTGSRIQ